MNHQTIAEIYEANARIREKLKGIIAGLSEEQVELRLNETGWTIRQIVEHLSIVENGMAKIAAKLFHKAAEENIPNDSSAHISGEFLTKASSIANRREVKTQAPDRVTPSGTLTISESLAKMEETAQILGQIRDGLEKIDTRKHKFPHPFLGDLNATEWLALLGGHEFRHIDQIEEILSSQK